MLNKMYKRISLLRENHVGKTGVVDDVAELLNKRWENCAGFTVVQLRRNGSTFAVTRRNMSGSVEENIFNVDVEKKCCDCGIWQEHGVPCIDAIAYMRIHKKMPLATVLANEVSKHYTYEEELALLEMNLQPVCVQRLCKDGITLPPNSFFKRSTGRPKLQRIRKRTKFANEPEKSPHKCGLCGKPGHHRTTCLTRQVLAGQGDNANNVSERTSFE
jgi:hypothetical protein